MTIINAKVPMLLASIEKIDTKELKSNEIVNIISVKKELVRVSEIVAESQEKILSSYGIKSNNGMFSWSHHEDADDISEKIHSLLNEESEIMTVPNIEHENFYYAVRGLTITEIEELSNILLQK